MNNSNELQIYISGKYSDFKKSEYELMMARINAINKTLTFKCRKISTIPLDTNFSFNFIFKEMNEFLKTIDDYDIKPRKDNLQKWWMNHKTSLMSRVFLASILDRIESISKILAQQENTELMSNKFEEYIKFELLESSLKCTFHRSCTKGSSTLVFPSTAFQYKRSRLRQKLDNRYFTESELINMNDSKKKKKEEWIKLVEIKRQKCEQLYCKYKVKILMQHVNNNVDNNECIRTTNVKVLNFQTGNIIKTNTNNINNVFALPPTDNSNTLNNESKKRKINYMNNNCIQIQSKTKKRKLNVIINSNNNNINVNEWSLDDVLNWFKKIGYEKYISKLRPQFIEDEINGIALKVMDMNDLKDYGIKNFYDRKMIVNQIEKL